MTKISVSSSPSCLCGTCVRQSWPRVSSAAPQLDCAETPARPRVLNPPLLDQAWKFPSDKRAPFKINRQERCPEFIVVDCFKRSRPHSGEATHQTPPKLPSNFPQLIRHQLQQRIKRFHWELQTRKRLLFPCFVFFLICLKGSLES